MMIYQFWVSANKPFKNDDPGLLRFKEWSGEVVLLK